MCGITADGYGNGSQSSQSTLRTKSTLYKKEDELFDDYPTHFLTKIQLQTVKIKHARAGKGLTMTNLQETSTCREVDGESYGGVGSGFRWLTGIDGW